jgi:hypothetical protein
MAKLVKINGAKVIGVIKYEAVGSLALVYLLYVTQVSCVMCNCAYTQAVAWTSRDTDHESFNIYGLHWDSASQLLIIGVLSTYRLIYAMAMVNYLRKSEEIVR